MKTYLRASVWCCILSRSSEVHFYFYPAVQMYSHFAEFKITLHYFISEISSLLFPSSCFFFFTRKSAPTETLNHEGLCASFLLELFKTSKNPTDYSGSPRSHCPRSLAAHTRCSFSTVTAFHAVLSDLFANCFM